MIAKTFRQNSWMTLRSLSILLLVLCHTACSSENYVSKLDSLTQFDEFSGPPLTNKYHTLKAVKVVYDIANQKIYYINHSHYKLHFDFCNSITAYPLDAYTFNQKNYSNGNDREYLLANINYSTTSDQYFLELSPTDLMSTENIELLYNTILKSSYLDDNLRFYLNNPKLLADSTLQITIPTIHPKDIYAELKFQPIYQGMAVGKLKRVKVSDLSNAQLEPTDIVILDRTPLFLPRVAGVIVREMQTPLSHLTILGQNRKIPICSSLDTEQIIDLKNLEDSSVIFKVHTNGFSIEKTKRAYTSMEQLPKLKLRADLSKVELIDLDACNNKSRFSIGNKAANLAMLQKLSQKREFKTPEGAFAIPFHFYLQHLKSSGTDLIIDTLLTEKHARQEEGELLKRIRRRIKDQPVDKELLVSIHSRMISDSLYNRMRFRSSTNAEDEIGFSGAGLYSSKTAILDNPKNTVSKAVKSVWASLWSDNAYLEREIFNIDQSSVFMGILVHRSFPNEVLNGVAITKNLYRPENEGYVVNVQLGEHSVVKPDSGIIPDQFICHPKQSGYNSNYSGGVIDIITTSTLARGKLLMTNEEITNLANELYAIKRYFSTRTLLSSSDFNIGYDVEFKLYGAERRLYVKQVRVYNN